MTLPPPPQFLTEMQTLYRQLDTEIAARSAVCANRGLCCHFGRTGHRLYVTTAEWVYFLSCMSAERSGETPVAASVHPSHSFRLPVVGVQRCPYQVDGCCTVRACRPIGCRIYFCDENSQSWQNTLYEQFHARLIQLGDRFGLPYQYREWLALLADLP